MTLLDVNVVIALIRGDSVHHEKARLCFESFVLSREMIGWHPAISSAVIRITTNRSAFVNPSTLVECKTSLQKLMEHPSSVRVLESDRFWQVFTDLLQKYQVAGPSVSDFYWAALAIDSGATLCSADQQFGRVKELRWHNLLA